MPTSGFCVRSRFPISGVERSREPLGTNAPSVHGSSVGGCELLDTNRPSFGQHYDVVCNGCELGSGSVRIHNRELQERVFSLLGYSKEEAKAGSEVSWKLWSMGHRPTAVLP